MGRWEEVADDEFHFICIFASAVIMSSTWGSPVTRLNGNGNIQWRISARSRNVGVILSGCQHVRSMPDVKKMRTALAMPARAYEGEGGR